MLGGGIEQERKKEKNHRQGQQCGDCGGVGDEGRWRRVWAINGVGRILDLG